MPRVGAPSFLREIWANKWIKLLALLLGLALLGYFTYRVRTILTSLAIAWVFAYICDPVVTRLSGRRISRSAAIGLLAAGLVVVLTVAELVLVPIAGRQLAALSENLPDYADVLTNKILPRVEHLFNIEAPRNPGQAREFFQANRELIDAVARAIYSPVTNFLKGAVHGVLDFLTRALTLLVAPVAWFYLLRDIEKIKAGIVELTPTPWRAPLVDFARQVDVILSNFLRGQITVALILGVLYTIGLWLILDIPLGILIGVAAGCAAIIPYMGLIVGVVPAFALALLQYQDWQHPVGVLAVFGVAQALEGNFITPRVVGDKLGLHPLTVMFALLVWAELAGFLGVLIAVPATAVLQVLLSRLVRRIKTGEAHSSAGD